MMIFLKLLLSSGLIFIAATASTYNESLCDQSSKYITPIHYDIKLLSYFEGNIFYGECNISISILNKTQHIYLHSEQLCVKNVELIKNFERYHENDKDTVYKLTYNTIENTIDILFMNELSPRNYILNIKYHGIADEVFKIFNVKKLTAWVGAPHFQKIGAGPLIPCWEKHNLLLNAIFKLSIGCTHCTALSNMPMRNTEIDKNNLVWKHFGTTPAMSPHLAKMVVSNYLFLHDNKTENIKMWYRYKSKFYMEFAKNVVKNFMLHIDKNIPKYSKMILHVTHAAIPNFYDKSDTVFGLVLYRETDIIYDKNLHPVAHKIQVAQLVGHIYIIYPEFRIVHLFVVQHQHNSFYLDDYRLWNSTSQDDSLLQIRQSIRAPCIVRMVQQIFYDQIFWKRFCSYINSTMADIGLQTFKYWGLEKYCPLIKIIRNYKDTMNEANVLMQNINTLKIDCLPVTFTIQTSPNFTEFTHHMVCVSKVLKISLPFEEKGWMIFNIQQIGYYRVNYDSENWRRISNYLNTNDHTKIHVLNRAQIIDDAFHLMIAGQLDSAIFWDITLYLQQEIDYTAWYPMFKALEYMFNTFLVWEERMMHFKNRIMQGLNNVLKRIKYKEIDDIDELRKCLRQEAARWACFLGGIICKKTANNKLKQHIKDPETHRLLPWWKEWTYCNGLMININETTWKSVYNAGLEKSDTKFSEYLACTQDANIIKDHLTLKYINITQREYQYLVNNFLHIITKHAKNPTILLKIMYIGHLIEKWDALVLNGHSIADMFFMAPDYDGRSVTVTVTSTPKGRKGLNASPARDSARKSVRVEKDEEKEIASFYREVRQRDGSVDKSGRAVSIRARPFRKLMRFPQDARWTCNKARRARVPSEAHVGLCRRQEWLSDIKLPYVEPSSSTTLDTQDLYANNFIPAPNATCDGIICPGRHYFDWSSRCL
ncbi:endoplasmic reticulum aminopeptidase 1-like [Nylanderia fulva]|uniref:endoplasmic reticulum aminopeptidase 1-like n=1 Tax=Nylanderia fulva TaxID=613905 RepID=UPI0010FBB99B|nr:endoplasmic reticulum aminopeptidase 1-like [Nylanderia fulva]